MTYLGSYGSIDGSKNVLGGFFLSALGLEPLMTQKPDGSLKPWLARSMTQPSATVYIYHLRRGVRFWNGKELTAADVANSLNYLRYPGSQYGFAYGSVKTVKATDRYTVKVTLKRADPSWKFWATLYAGAIFEKKHQNENKSTFGQPGTLAIGTGPWKFDRLDPTRGAELSANPRWWGGKVPIQRISIRFFAEQNSMALAFRAGALDVIGPQHITDPRAWSATTGATLIVGPSCHTRLFSMNVGMAPWNDVHVRRAVAYAVRRTDVIRGSGQVATPINTLVLPLQLRSIATQSQVNALLKSIPQYPFNLRKAREEMAKSTYPNGFSYTVPLTALGAAEGQVLANQLEEIGIDLDIRVLSGAQYFDQVLGPADKRPATFTGGGCPSLDPSGNDVLIASKATADGQFNVANYRSSAADALILAGRKTLDPAQRLVIYTKLLKRLALDMPYLPLYSAKAVYAISEKYTWQDIGPYTGYMGVWPLGIKPK